MSDFQTPTTLFPRGHGVNPPSRSNLILGLICLAFAAVTIFVWVPLDTDTGIVEKVRGRYGIGDALAPTVAALFIALGGLVLLLFERKVSDQPVLSAAEVRFVGIQLTVLVVGFLIILYAGPLVLWAFDGDAEYRLLRDTPPWKYIGFFFGGTFILTALIARAEGAFSWRILGIAVTVVIALILIYDVPFDDLLLPPNGDV